MALKIMSESEHNQEEWRWIILLDAADVSGYEPAAHAVQLCTLVFAKPPAPCSTYRCVAQCARL